MKSTQRPPLVGGGRRKRSEARWGGAGRSSFHNRRKIFGAPLKPFFCFFSVFVFICKSPLWPEGTSARLIPGIPGLVGEEGMGGVKG